MTRPASTAVLLAFVSGCALSQPGGFPTPYYVPPPNPSVIYPARGWTAEDIGGGVIEVRGSYELGDISESKEYEVSRRGQELWLIAVVGRKYTGTILTAGRIYHRGWFQQLPPGRYRVHVYIDLTWPVGNYHRVRQEFDSTVVVK